MKKHLPWILLLIVVVLILVPLAIAFFLSFRVIVTDTTNEWIGFWGGYLGAIIGGIITLYVMYQTNKESRINLDKTLEVEKNRIMESQKRQFDDEILNLVLEYHTKISAILATVGNRTVSEDMWNSAQRCMVLPKALVIKLTSRKNLEDYHYCEELIDAINLTAKSFEILTKTMNKNDEEIKKDAIEVCKKAEETMYNDIVKYYELNEKF